MMKMEEALKKARQFHEQTFTDMEAYITEHVTEPKGIVRDWILINYGEIRFMEVLVVSEFNSEFK